MEVSGQLHSPAALSPGEKPDMDTEIYRRQEKIAVRIRKVARKITRNTLNRARK